MRLPPVISLERLGVISLNVFALGYYLGAKSPTAVNMEFGAAALLYVWLFTRSSKVAVAERSAIEHLRLRQEKGHD